MGAKPSVKREKILLKKNKLLLGRIDLMNATHHRELMCRRTEIEILKQRIHDLNKHYRFKTR
jgi:hypothetical protein